MGNEGPPHHLAQTTLSKPAITCSVLSAFLKRFKTVPKKNTLQLALAGPRPDPNSPSMQDIDMSSRAICCQHPHVLSSPLIKFRNNGSEIFLVSAQKNARLLRRRVGQYTEGRLAHLQLGGQLAVDCSGLDASIKTLQEQLCSQPSDFINRLDYRGNGGTKHLGVWESIKCCQGNVLGTSNA